MLFEETSLEARLDNVRFTLVLRASLGLGCCLPGCSGPTDWSNGNDMTDGVDLVAIGSETGRVVYLDAGGPTILRTAPESLGQPGATAFDWTSRIVYFISGTQNRTELSALNLRTGRVVWRIPLADGGQPATYDGVRLSGYAIAWIAQGRMLLFPAQRGGIVGIATFDPVRRKVGTFRGPLEVAGLASCANGMPVAFVTVGQPVNGRRRFATLVLSPTNLEMVDSIEAPVGYYGVIPDPTCNNGHVPGVGQLALYSIAGHQITAAAPIQVNGYVAVSPAGFAAISDAGLGLDDPGSGRIYIYDEHLGLQKAVDLTSVATTPDPVVTNLLAWSHDGRLVYVSAGTGPATLYPPQRAQVIVVDAATLELVGSVRLEDWSGVLLFPLR